MSHISDFRVKESWHLQEAPERSTLPTLQRLTGTVGALFAVFNSKHVDIITETHIFFRARLLIVKVITVVG